ncbi:hypothetical protein [Kitasatospora sp. NPDC005751]|uniref:hypothetical protein n=1 Tax=Kitasatospora sp. NPDC005751 TaxID=3157064 RepID=UPI0033C420B1
MDTAPATATGHGRAVTCFLYDAAPLTATQAGALRFADGEVRAASWLDPGEAVRRLPRHLAARLTAALRALEDGGIVPLRAGVPATPAQGAGATAGAAHRRRPPGRIRRAVARDGGPTYESTRTGAKRHGAERRRMERRRESRSR